MRAHASLLCRPARTSTLILALLSLSLLSLSPQAGAAAAADHASAPAAKPAAAEPAIEAKARKTKPATDAHGPRDPIEVLRERLAQKLGASKVAAGANPNVVRVVSKTGAPAAAAAAEIGRAHV